MASIDRSSAFNDSERYEKLCAKGASRGKAARITCSAANSHGRGAKFSKYEKWTTDELYQKAAEVGIDGRAHMSKQALIDALREH